MKYTFEINSVTVQFDREYVETVTYINEDTAYISPKHIIADIDGILRHGDHIYLDVRYTLRRVNDYAFWTLDAGYGTLYEAYDNTDEVPQEVINAVALFEENFT